MLCGSRFGKTSALILILWQQQTTYAAAWRSFTTATSPSSSTCNTARRATCARLCKRRSAASKPEHPPGVVYSATARIEPVPMVTKKMEFSYKDGEDFVFTDPEDYETVTLAAELIGDAKNYLADRKST